MIVYFKLFLYVDIFKKVAATPGLMNKIKVVLYGPGWVPNVPGLPRTGDPSAIPEVYNNKSNRALSYIRKFD